MALAALVAVPARAETELVVAAYPPLDESVKLAIPRFEALHPGVKVKLVSRAFGDHHAAAITALVSGQDVPDVVGLDVSFVGRFAESRGALEDLGIPPYGARNQLQKLLPFAAAQATSYWVRPRGREKEILAIPADVGPGTLLYRKDILEKAGVTEDELTRSWESFIEAGRKVKAATGAALVADVQEWVFLYLRTGVGHGERVFFSSQGRALFGTPRFQRAFSLAKQAREAGIDAKTRAWSNDWVEGLRDGKIASLMAGSWMGDSLQRWVAPETEGLWRATQLPGGAFVRLGGSFYAIPARATHKSEAWSFVQLLCFDRAQQIAAWKASGAWPALKVAQDDPFVDAPVPFLGGQPARRLWKVAAARIPATVDDWRDGLAEDVLKGELEQILEKGKGIPKALEDASDPRCTPTLRCLW